MKVKSRILCFTLLLTILLIGVTVVSAADSDNTTSQDPIIEDKSVDSVVSDNVENEYNIVKQSQKTLKQDEEEYNGITVGQSNFSTYFDSNGYTTSNVSNNSNLRFSGEINLNQNIYIDKALNITATNNAIIKLNTNTFTINTTGSNTNVTRLNFYNTAVFVTAAENVTLNQINVTVEDASIGWNTGVTSIRDGSRYVTVANSTFYTEDNDGSSTLVLADAQNCTIDNNTITAEGNVGNLLYLTTYNTATTPTVDSNSYNIIKNNILNGPSTVSSICWAIVLTGHNNTIYNNTINYQGVAITSQAINIIDEDTYDNDYSVNNTISYNRINNQAPVLILENATVIGNNFTGAVVIRQNSRIEHNIIPNEFNVADNCNVSYNQFDSDVIINENILFEYNNVTGELYIISDNNSILYNNLNNVYLIEGASNNTVEYNSMSDVRLESDTFNNTIIYNNLTEIRDDNENSTNIVTPNNIVTNMLNKNLKMDSEYTFIEINNKNYATYFSTRTENNKIKLQTFKSSFPKTNVILYFNDTLEGISLINIDPYKQPSIIVTANPNITFENIKFRVATDVPVTVTNMSFEYDRHIEPNDVKNYANLIELRAITSTNINASGTFVLTGNITVDNVTVNSHFSHDDILEYDESQNTFVEKNLPNIIDINSTIKIVNSKINISCYASSVEWTPGADNYGTNQLIPINIEKSSKSLVEMYNNSIFINTTETIGSYPTTYGMNIRSNYSIIENNNITLVADEGWSYAIRPVSTSAYIANNNISVTGINYTAGIGLENAYNCIVTNNTITVNSSLATGGSNEYCAYAIFLNDYNYGGGHLNVDRATIVNNTISNNHIIGYAYNTYAIEEFGGRDTKIINNTIEIPNSNTAMGIGVIGHNITIKDNNVTVNGSSVTGSTVDYLGAMTTGIYIARVGNSTVTGNTINSTKLGMYMMNENNDQILDNRIITDYENAIFLLNTNNTNITNNYLQSKELVGDEAVINTRGTNNIIKDNQPKLEIKVDTTSFTIGENANITASIYYNNEVLTDINKGKVVFKVNGKTLKDSEGKVIYAKIVNGTTSIINYEVPESWDKDNIKIEAVYSGSAQCTALRSQKTDMTINKIVTPSITTEDITATTQSDITLTAQVMLAKDLESKAKVVFKINGKSVKDSNGKVIYAQVNNGVVSVNYTLPSTLKAKSYNIVAVLIMPNYERLEDSKTLTLTKA